MREVDQALVQYLTDFDKLMSQGRRPGAKIYSSLFDFLLKEGKLFNPEPYTDAEEKELLASFKHLSHIPIIKQCFYNSQALSLDEGLGYAEGQVINTDIGIPIEHGWNFLTSGKVVDVTLRPFGEKNTSNPKKLLERAKQNQKNAYFGIPFPASLIRKTWLTTGQALQLMSSNPVLEVIFEQGFPSEWHEGDFWNRAVPSPWELSGLMPSSNFIAEPSPLGSSDLFMGRPSWASNFSPEPPPSEYGDASRMGPSWKMAPEPSPAGFRATSRGSSRETVARPSPLGGALSGPRPEEEWLNQPEREEHEPDATHSPFEGDIPPWAQRGYAGVFPLGKKVFYITAYVLLGPQEISRKAPVESPVLGDALHVANVGDLPEGNFGSDLMYHPFAAIPVRQEDRNEGGEIVDYLVALINELGVYGKILIEERFPSGDEVRLANGRWFPVYKESRIYGGIDFINAYNTNRFYGGPHEGGWWYDAGDPVASVPIRAEDPASKLEWEGYLREKVGWTSQHDTSSVLGHDVFEIRHDDFFARPFPEETPHYE